MKNSQLPNLEDTNPNNWRGIFYVNKKDKRLIVPKKAPTFGWTLNFGNPYSYVLIVVFLGTLVAYALFS
ncbi:MAG: hypothetical protein JXR65_09460 [Bacteroidales bacterium]|nr:hypothetical protein [Bacteroidales bacterium]